MPETTPTLLERQKNLVDQIIYQTEKHFVSHHRQATGLAIYRNNLYSTATRALMITYPVLKMMLGEDVCRFLAKQLLRSEPMFTGDWGDWGESLSDVIATTQLARSYPFLQDMAQLEWCIHQSERTRSETFNKQSLNSVGEQDFLQSEITLSQSLRFMESRYPIDHIWHAHQSPNTETEQFQITLANAIAEHSGTCHLVVHNSLDGKKCTNISEQEYLWLKDASEFYTIGELLDRHPTFNFIDWLAKAIQNNWISSLSSTSANSSRHEHRQAHANHHLNL